MSLPRPVKQVLRDEALDASVVRTWARLQRSRRLGGRRAPWLWVPAGAVVLVVLLAATWPAPKVAPVKAELPKPEPVKLAQATPSVSTLLARGRQQVVPRAVTGPRPVASAEAAPVVPPDVVGALMESAAEALRGGDAERAVALLSEVASHHEADVRAPTALIALGRLQLEVLHRREEAVVSLTRALELGPPEDLVVPTWRALEEAKAGPQ